MPISFLFQGLCLTNEGDGEINRNEKAIPSSFPDSHFLVIPYARFAGGRHTNSLDFCKASQVGNLNC